MCLKTTTSFWGGRGGALLARIIISTFAFSKWIAHESFCHVQKPVDGLEQWLDGILMMAMSIV